jgi:iron complex outermembrane receptor protein
VSRRRWRQDRPRPAYGASVQAGSFGTVVNSDYVTGSTTPRGLSYRVDGTFSHADGFRDLASHDYEILPQLHYQWAGHTTNVAVDLRIDDAIRVGRRTLRRRRS